MFSPCSMRYVVITNCKTRICSVANLRLYKALKGSEPVDNILHHLKDLND